MESDALQKWAGNLIKLLEKSAVPIAVYDQDDILCFANLAFREAFGLASDEFVSWTELVRRAYARGAGTLVQTENFDQWLMATKSRRGKQPFREFETNLNDGRWLWMTETFDADGWSISVAPDISRLQANDHRLMRLDRDIAIRTSTTDELTGCMNRRGILAELGKLVASSQDGAGFALALLDIDYFKQVNDTYGHPAGDAVLCHFVEHLHSRIRSKDLLGRYGGEEFLVIFPGCSNVDAVTILETIRQTLAPINSEGVEVSYNFSAGITNFKIDETVDQMLKQADRALYAAKQQGRGRSCIARSDRT
ncbi:sensor domain-containing diguanylate cyclase [Pseudomonas typographi]|uniref:sensor domain-containing diguanylate cyclase n=1 Tax=Pseudomonas typographi TaxID=2715964 RepID=UPI0016833307|nr:sensor domain-containing diguanylate cyclase [Pseudomonas typographi]MBD1555206.1 diguanylate cyclase [Pseudomonas typographi]